MCAYCRFCYQDPGLERFAIYKDGASLPVNERLKNLEIDRGSGDLSFLYENFLRAFGTTAQDITQDQFQHDIFVLAFNLSPNPVIEDQQSIAPDNGNVQLSPISGGVLDIECNFKTALSENYCIYFVAISNLCLSFNESGIPLEV